MLIINQPTNFSTFYMHFDTYHVQWEAMCVVDNMWYKAWAEDPQRALDHLARKVELGEPLGAVPKPTLGVFTERKETKSGKKSAQDLLDLLGDI